MSPETASSRDAHQSAWLAGAALGLLVLALFLLPLVGGQYAQYLAIQVMILSLFALGFNILFGYSGLLSFGQAGFYAVGAYGCAKLLLIMPSLLFGVLGGTLLAGAVAMLLGVLCIRHTRIYFSMLTLAFGMMIYSVALNWRDFTGGDDGLVGVPRAPITIPGLLSLDMATMQRYYFFVLVATLLATALAYRLVRSPLGLTLQGIRDSETRMAFTGVPVRRYRLIAFVIAGLYAGLAGALLPPLENTVTPPVAHWSTSADPVLATLLGGIQAFAGPIVGAFLLFIIKDIIVRFTEYWLICLGVIVVALVMGFRGGVASLISERWSRLGPGRERK
ncbi:MAG TPA: branched-chain amino acid ABC transporter permease [Candidatus Methylomirabilis sp.]|nr:branched-chain amino acid ABC transporter permease [Candidatus Methylomirabilis sp.]HSC70949.1 branched-chain amino acid ABC transporter permease [Candidatus Methylomirabilis sp.]